MGQHGVQQCLVADLGLVETQFQVRRTFLANGLAHAQASTGNQIDQGLAHWRLLQVFDDLRLSASIAD